MNKWVNERLNQSDTSLNDLLVTVDNNDVITGYESKLRCHQGLGILHRAFSLFVFNNERQLLVQQRSALKPLWPLYWSNSVCSHPRKGEPFQEAVNRRLKEEMGVTSQLTYLYQFEYHEPYLDVGAEHEMCSVYIGKIEQNIKVDPAEVADIEFMSMEEVNRLMIASPERLTPWFKMEWQQLMTQHREDVDALFR
ncbi:isopentenyl-diphosphate Delta-isomerase [Shewanella surugensis]|uniref:Isopentenyl-diphosphate Delta-isomerase n=1 Tax=Shewanella surugensis TaxID=212020 RepID=A0ABT0L839_9GAMM|nr:isopentenyl-diphosphate Delta-isomerase [Shewanella surugensis]MCL1123851.1 isopentenyl-diphosphate Delta-isomerase [Shewanella surugensis]